MQIICAICCEVFTNDNLKSVCCCPCGHIFHSACINQWFEREQSCPECRQEIKEKGTIQLFFNVESEGENTEDTPESLRFKIDDLKCQLYVKEADVKFLKKENETLGEQKQKLQCRLKEVQNNHQITVSTLENRTQCLNAVKRKIEELDETHKRVKTEEQEIISYQKRELAELTRINELLRQKLNADYQNLDDSELHPFSRSNFDVPSSSIGPKPYHKSYRNASEEEVSGYPYAVPLGFPHKHQESLGCVQPISLVKNQPYHAHTSRSHSDQPIRAHQSSYLPHSSKSHCKSLSQLSPYPRSRPPHFESIYSSGSQQNDSPSCSGSKSNVPIHSSLSKSDFPFYGHFPSSSSSTPHCPPWLTPIQQSGLLNSSEAHPPSFVQRYPPSSSYQYPKEQEDVLVFPSSWGKYY